MSFPRICASLFIATITLPLATAAQEFPPGAEIVEKVNARDDGESLYREMKITMTDKRGKTRVQETLTYRKYYGDDKKAVIFYTEPANVKDTAFLSFDYADNASEDDQWLYLPSLRKVRRISSSNRGDYYLGTDLTYEDMKLDTRLSAADYNWETTGEEPIDGKPCWVIEGTPINDATVKEVGYSRYKAWVDKEIHMVRQAHLWDINGNPLKTVHFQDFEQINGVWSVLTLKVDNQKTGHSTVLAFDDLDYSEEIDDDMFTERALQRGLR